MPAARDPGVPSPSVCCFEWSVVTVHVSERVGDEGFSVFSMCYYGVHMDWCEDNRAGIDDFKVTG